MKRRMMLFVMMNVILVGCCPSDDGTAAARLRSEIDGCVCAIANGTGGERSSRRVERLVSEMSALSDKEILSLIVTDFATRLETVELCVRDLGYEGYEEAVCRYNACADGVARLKREALGEEEEWLAFFLKSKRKFRKFCFSVSVSTNPMVKTVVETHRIRERLNMVEDDAARRGALQTWRKTLMSLDLTSLPVLDRVCIVREIGHCLLWYAVGARCDMGASYIDRWNDYFETLTWIDGQVAALKPELSGEPLPQDQASRRKLQERWDAYLVAVECRENVIENLEIDGFDERVFPQDIEDMKAIRDRFERIIGRRVRARKEIARLGTFAKEARPRR